MAPRKEVPSLELLAKNRIKNAIIKFFKENPFNDVKEVAIQKFERILPTFIVRHILLEIVQSETERQTEFSQDFSACIRKNTRALEISFQTCTNCLGLIDKLSDCTDSLQYLQISFLNDGLIPRYIKSLTDGYTNLKILKISHEMDIVMYQFKAIVNSCRNLEELNLASCTINRFDETEDLIIHKNLQILKVHCFKQGENVMSNFFDKFPNLTTFHYCYDTILNRPQKWPHNTLSKIVDIKVKSFIEPLENIVKVCPNLKKIEILFIFDNKMYPLGELTKLTKLEEIDLNVIRLERGISDINNLITDIGSNLTTIRLTRVYLDIQSLSNDCPKLKTLKLHRCTFNELDFENITEFNLEWLTLDLCDMSDSLLEAFLLKCKSLRCFEIACYRFSKPLNFIPILFSSSSETLECLSLYTPYDIQFPIVQNIIETFTNLNEIDIVRVLFNWDSYISKYERDQNLIKEINDFIKANNYDVTCKTYSPRRSDFWFKGFQSPSS